MKKNIWKDSNMNKKKVIELLSMGIPLQRLSQQLGHSSVDTIVRVYLQESHEVTKEFYRQIYPRK